MCILIGLSSTPRGRRSGSDDGPLCKSDLADRFPDYTDARDLRCDLLEQFKPFAGQRKFELGKPGDVTAGTRDAPDEAGPDRVDGLGHHDRHGAGRLLQGARRRPDAGDDHVRPERDQVGRVLAQARQIAAAPAHVDPQVAADRPARLLQALREAP